MKKLALLTCFLVPLVFGCEKIHVDSDFDEPNGNVVPIERHDIKLTVGQQKLVEKGNGFALNLLKEVSAQEKGSFMVSPLSVEYVLAMLGNGAAGNTRDEILSILGFGADQLDFANEFYRYLTEELYGADNTVRLNLANAMIYNTMHCGLRKDYISRLDNYYDALVKGFDFSKESRAAVSYINNWSKEQTRGMIPELVSELDSRIYLILMNALYFKGSWNSKNEFKESNTKPGNFQLGGKPMKKVDYMNQESNMPYSYNDYYQIASLKYGNGAFAMDVIVPHEWVTIEEALSSLSANYPKALRSDWLTKVKVKLPVFETVCDRIDLNRALNNMGMIDAFDPTKADFSLMTDNQIWVSDIFQKSKIKVNEKGSEAAAVTVVMMESSPGPGFTPPPIPEVYATRPFIYVIRETSTNAILFMGEYKGE